MLFDDGVEYKAPLSAVRKRVSKLMCSHNNTSYIRTYTSTSLVSEKLD